MRYFDLMRWITVIPILVLLLAITGLQAQFYTDYGLQIRQQGVYLTWTLNPGSTCQGTFIERSDDGVDFDTIGIIGGICGDPFTAISYEYLDTLPLVNQRSWYRLQFGNAGPSEVLTTEVIRLREDGVQILRFPNDPQVYLYFTNPANQSFLLRLYTVTGQLVEESTTRNNSVAVPASLASQFLLYELIVEGKRYGSGWLR